MHPKLIDLFRDGAEIRYLDRATPRPIDFAVETDSATLVYDLGWWQRGATLAQNLNTIPALVEDVDGVWTFSTEGQHHFTTPADETVALAIEHDRQRISFNKARYLRALAREIENNPDADYNAWLAEILSWPEIDVLELSRGATAEREIGRIALLDADGRVEDALVIDASGSAACARPDGFLAHHALAWADFTEVDRPSISGFLGPLAGSTAYGGRVLGTPTTISAAGDLEAIALQLVAG